MKRQVNNRQVSTPAAVLTRPQVGRIRAILMLGGIPFDGVDDGIQQVQLKLVESAAPPNRPVRNVDAWIGVVASRVAVDWHRTHARDAGLTRRLEQQPPPPQAGEQQRLLARLVADELEALPPSDRQILVLRFYADLTIPQIAEALGVPKGTAKSRLHRASASLRERLKEGDPRHD